MSVRRRILVLASSALAALLACEVGLRVYLFRFASDERLTKYARFDDVPDEAHVYRGHPFTNYCLNEGYRSRDGLSRHGSLGLRGPEVSARKPEGAYRIVCIGGSTTYCTEIRTDALAYPAQLERILREEHGDEQVEVLNAGVGGWSSWECLIDLELRLLDLEPDLLVVYHGINDVYPRFVPPELYRGDDSGRVRQWQPGNAWWEHSVLLRCLGVKLGFALGNTVEDLVVRSYHELDLDSCLDPNPPVYFERNLEATVALAKHFGVESMLATFAWCEGVPDYVSWPPYRRALGEGNLVIRRVAEKNGVSLLDFAAVMDRDPALWNDGRHVNAKGAKVQAELFAGFIHATFLASR
jgi:lysophospholipase L1-like esterase